MRKDLRNKILGGLIAGIVLVTVASLLWGEVKFENQLRELDRFCAELKVQTSLTDIQTTLNFTPRLRMILLDQSSEGNQVGSIYFEGSGRWACSVSFAQGRLTQRSFGSHNLASDPGAPVEKLKPW